VWGSCWRLLNTKSRPSTPSRWRWSKLSASQPNLRFHYLILALIHLDFFCILVLLMQISSHWNPRASVRQVMESRPSVPVNLTWNWQGRKQSQIRERIGCDSEYLSSRHIGKLCRYWMRQKDIECKRIIMSASVKSADALNDKINSEQPIAYV